MGESEFDEAEEILRRHVSQLMEHFSSIRIFATWSAHDDDGPASVASSQGGGNFFAVLGQVRQWLIQQDHRAWLQVVGKDADDEDDDP